MFADDIVLVQEMIAKYGPAHPPIVDVGGLESPTIADYGLTVQAMIKAADRNHAVHFEDIPPDEIKAAQHARYLGIQRPLSFLGDYIIENPESGGLPIERLHEKYPRAIGTAVLLSVLEHVANPFQCAALLREAMQPGGLVIVSVPWTFPHHPSPQDNWRFSPSALRWVFSDWSILECDWRLDIPAEAGVRCIRTGYAQIIQSCFIVARAV